MADAAVACAKAVGYVGAGTVEFLVDSVTNEFYFCEMNTRLQVEHPATEMVTGVDLVEWQLMVASGFPIPDTQEEIIENTEGCAIEARIYAEQPTKDFLPATGKISSMMAPDSYWMDGATGEMAEAAEEGVRTDTGFGSGDEISTFYDPMIAKLIVHAATRPEAVLKLERALRDFRVAGLANNVDFLVKCVQHPEFSTGKPTTAFFDHYLDGILDDLNVAPKPEHTVLAIAAAIAQGREAHAPECEGLGPWGSTADWRLFGSVNKRITMPAVGDEGAYSVNIARNGNLLVNTEESSSGPQSVTDVIAEAHSTPGTWNVFANIDGRKRSGLVNLTGANVDVWLNGEGGEDQTHATFTLPIVDYGSSDDASGRPVVNSPMPGKVVRLMANPGDMVKAGDTLIVLEAMKMEHVVAAPCDGEVVFYSEEGASIQEGSKLAEILVGEDA
jgi:3-methylcrotonyl-CoA carboxylase alpha subunit